MNSAQFKDFYREIRGTLNRFLSIFAIVLLGVAFFVGLKATTPDMEYTADAYYDKNNTMDIQIMSTLGLTKDDVEAVSKVDGVKQAQGGYFADVLVKTGLSEMVLKIHSLPSGYLKGEDGDYLNQVEVVEGRLPENPGECVIESSRNIDLGLSIGNKIKVSSGTDTAITKDTLATDEFLVVGKVVTPYYLTYDKGSSTIGDGTVFSYIMISEDDFIYDVYTEILVSVAGAADLNTFGAAYEDRIATVQKAIEGISAERAQSRADGIKGDAHKELKKAKDEFAKQEADFNDQISAAESELSSALNQINEGEATLNSERDSFNMSYEEAQQEVADAEAQLADAEAEYQDGLNEYNEAVDNYQAVLDAMDEAEPQLSAEYESAYSGLQDINAQLEADDDLTEEERSNLQTQADYYQNELDAVAYGYDYISEQNSSAKQQMSDAESQLADARSQLDASQAELAQAKSDLANAKSQADSEFAAAEGELASAQDSYNSGQSQLASEKANGEKQLEDARKQLALAEAEIEKLENPEWYVLNRNQNSSFVDYSMTLNRINAIANICPTFFMLVAALVCLTTMTRMIDEQRGVIGTYKALGYSNKEIVKKYLFYAGFASLLGGFFGLIFGLALFPKTVYNAWSMMYQLPELSSVLQLPLMLFSLLIGVIVMLAASYFACQKELKTTPALLMRPKPPKAGKTIILERFRLLWKHLSFSQKVTARNIFRYKKRFWMTVIGIAGCAALLLAGFGLSDSVGKIVDKQYKQIFQFNIDMRYNAEATTKEKLDVEYALEKNEAVGSMMEYSYINATISSNGTEESATMMIPSDESIFNEYVLLRERSGQQEFTLPAEGIVLTEKLAKELNVGVGDKVKVENGDGITKEVAVSNITENYIFHYAYMNYDFYNNTYGYQPDINSLLIKLINSNDKLESEIGSNLVGMNEVSSVIYYSGYANNFESQISSINDIVWLVLICAALLAFVVLYNLTNINISERIREIATIKVLGFNNKEVTLYVYRENIILTAVGALFGLGLGVMLHRVLMDAIEQEGIMFGYSINLSSFIIAFLLTLFFSILVSLFMYRRLMKIPMVESLKTVE